MLDILSASVGVDARRVRLERYVTWTGEQASAFEEALQNQQTIDADLWR